MLNQIVVIAIVFFVGFSCRFQEKQKTEIFQDEAYNFHYNLNHPDNNIKLSGTLQEISGIAFYKDDLLACVQDEKGIIFIIDAHSGKIQDQIRFAKDGDYEDIELLGSDAWVLNSKGDLFKVADFSNDDKKSTTQFKTELSSSNDCEGLTFDPENNCLLISCKASPFLGKKKADPHLKAIYAFNLITEKLDTEPRFLIHLDSVKKHLELNTMENLGLKVYSKINPAIGDVSFQPSAILLDTSSGDLFVIASVGKLFLVLNEEGKINYVSQLKKSLYPQPEGICIDEAQSLIISSEGKGSRARLLTLNKKINK